MKAGVLAKRADVVAPHGSRIYAYRHFLTNQVLYSLSRSLDNTSALKQLTFAGKKTVPRALRKDHWKPFFTAKFGLPHQGLKAFKKLREWRMMHELKWDPKTIKPLERTLEKEEEKKEELEELDELGGRRPGGRRDRLSDWKLRKKKHIMNQAENSVADLAAVLMQQEKQAIGFSEVNEKYTNDAIEWIPKLASNESARQEKLDSINKQLEQLEQKVKVVKEQTGKRYDLSLASKVRNYNREIRLKKTEYYHVSTLPEKVKEAATKTLSEQKSAEYAAILKEEIGEGLREKTRERQERTANMLVEMGLDRDRLVQAQEQNFAGNPELMQQIRAEQAQRAEEEWLRQQNPEELEPQLEQLQNELTEATQRCRDSRQALNDAELFKDEQLTTKQLTLSQEAKQLSSRQNEIRKAIRDAGESNASVIEELEREQTSLKAKVAEVVGELRSVQQELKSKRKEARHGETQEQRATRQNLTTQLNDAIAEEQSVKIRINKVNMLLEVARHRETEGLPEDKKARLVQSRMGKVDVLAKRLVRYDGAVADNIKWQDLLNSMGEIEARARSRFDAQQDYQQAIAAPVEAENEANANASSNAQARLAAGKASDEHAPLDSSSITLDVPVSGYGILRVTKNLSDLVNESVDKIRNLMTGIAPAPTDEMRLEDVSIEWANPLDAEFGRKWPADVEHLPMGYSRNTAPADHQERQLEVKERLGYDKNNTLLERSPESTEEQNEERLRLALAEEVMKRGNLGMVRAQKSLERQRHAEAKQAVKTERQMAARRVRETEQQIASAARASTRRQLHEQRVLLNAEEARGRRDQKRAAFIAKVEAEEPEKAAGIRRQWARLDELEAEKRRLKAEYSDLTGLISKNTQ
ncbi:hypothetical protein C1H76_2835 [Elsinoe australis]|uniref:Large ribosomal subunit protein mL67 n=1 Tax=Elsinoe australis TaxID=40998 RepID=A0A4V6DUL5_9PEZI|nr:hypothetical protein C1H76_2835 [Elsinoe australis]